MTCSQSPTGFQSGQLVFDIIKRERKRVFLLNSTGDRPVAGIGLSCEDMVTHSNAQNWLLKKEHNGRIISR